MFTAASSTKPRHKSNLSVHLHTNKWRQSGKHIPWNIIQSLKRMVHWSTLLTWAPLTFIGQSKVTWSSSKDSDIYCIHQEAMAKDWVRRSEEMRSNLLEVVWPPLSAPLTHDSLECKLQCKIFIFLHHSISNMRIVSFVRCSLPSV